MSRQGTPSLPRSDAPPDAVDDTEDDAHRNQRERGHRQPRRDGPAPEVEELEGRRGHETGDEEAGSDAGEARARGDEGAPDDVDAAEDETEHEGSEREE